ncbi:polysaccharide biosynthesis tyrosine autokinase [Aliishimia ponticola]|uniref:non-specific protein-tyrosine kinase n=1 Tax=Aliishimia ponticola TaxID=2499833 RepID=A0A4S4N8A9_9RHOB|nr:polysaccharide biosynthesis tyrosine autokinase [Aliishimia ponticola]THH35436.1 polysaccharide biosynthesis tyrosine autokinase [Aliishimia ponticola]
MNGNVQGIGAQGATPIRRAPARSDQSNLDFLDLSTLFGTLWRGKFTILAVMAIALAAGLYYAYLIATPLYRAKAVVMLDTREEQVVDIESVIGGLSSDASVVNTEVEVLKSRGLLSKVSTELDLPNDPEFNRFLREPGLIASWKLAAKRGLGLTEAPPTPTLPVKQGRMEDAAIDGLLERLTIKNVPNSLVFNVTVETTDAEKSAAIANTVVDKYILNQLEAKFDATRQATTWLSGRVGELRTSLEAAEAEVKAFRAKTDLVNSETLSALEVQLKDLRDRIVDSEAAIGAAQTRLDRLATAQTAQERATILQDPQLTRLLPRIDQPAISDAFDARVADVTARITLEQRRAEAQRSALATSRDQLTARIEAQSADLITLQQLTREAEASRLLYEYFLGRLKETSAQQGIQQADSRVLSAAVIPTRPASPRRPLILALCAMLGAVLGAALVFLREARRDTHRTAQHLENATGYPVMGQIATFPARNRKEALAYLMSKPNSEAAESIRNLRTSLLLSDADNPPQIMVVSSSLPGEGKTTIALSLAQNMVGMGRRVLLIEGDIRRQDFSAMFGGRKSSGLMSVLTGESTLSDAVLHDEESGIDVLLGDQGNYNAADLFSSDRFREVIAEMRGTYDQIIIDTPPVLIVPDARIIAQHADAILFVVKWDQTLQSQVSEALGMFESVNHPVSGLALNQISPRGMKRYGFDVYSGYGKKYYVN